MHVQAEKLKTYANLPVTGFFNSLITNLGAYMLLNKSSLNLLFTLTTALTLFGCQNTGANLQSNVYTAGQVNSVQSAKVIKILAVEPAQVEVDNTQQKQAAQVFGGLLGAVAGGVAGHSISHNQDGTAVGALGGGIGGIAAGSLVSDKVLVEGVSITYEYHHDTFNSAQVGKLCQFEPGKAIVVSTGPTSTRIQPNATCTVSNTKEDM